MQSAQSPLVLDASAAIVLFASGYITEILRSQPARVFVVQETIKEVNYLRDPGTSGTTGGKEPIDWSTVLSQGLVGMLERTHPQEFAELVRFAQLVDEGEAAAAAAAIHRGYDLALDDRKARRVLEGHVGLVWSLDLLHDWCQAEHIAADEISTILGNIRRKATYYPHRLHPRFDWWEHHFVRL